MVGEPVHERDGSVSGESVGLLAVQWTGNQQIVFVWAGTMHVLALALFWFWFKGRFAQIDVDRPLDVSRTHGGLAIAGGIVAAVGISLAALVASNWDYLKSAVKITGAVQSSVVAAAVFLIGLALFYASRPRSGG
jgi:ACS family hexuronate transporter-like MFS transporter